MDENIDTSGCSFVASGGFGKDDRTKRKKADRKTTLTPKERERLKAKPEVKDKTLNMRVTATMRDSITAWANKAGMSNTSFLEMAAEEYAKQRGWL